MGRGIRYGQVPHDPALAAVVHHVQRMSTVRGAAIERLAAEVDASAASARRARARIHEEAVGDRLHDVRRAYTLELLHLYDQFSTRRKG